MTDDSVVDVKALLQKRDQIKSQLSEQYEATSSLDANGVNVCYEDCMKEVINKQELHWNSVLKEAVS